MLAKDKNKEEYRNMLFENPLKLCVASLPENEKRNGAKKYTGKIIFESMAFSEPGALSKEAVSIKIST